MSKGVHCRVIVPHGERLFSLKEVMICKKKVKYAFRLAAP